MKKLIFTAILLSSTCLMKSQFLENKLNIYLGYGLGYFHGNQMLSEGNFIYPSLFNNYSKAYVLTIEAVAKVKDHLSFGLRYNTLSSREWKYLDYEDYSESTLNQYSFNPALRIHTRFNETGLLNRMKVFFEFQPILGLSELNLTNPIIEAPEASQISFPYNTKYLHYGIGIGFGIELTISNDAGIFINYFVNRDQISSNLFIDKKFVYSNGSMGIFVKVFKNKRYYY